MNHTTDEQRAIFQERFSKKVSPGKNGCIEWKAYIGKDGYGQFHLGKLMAAHRAAWILYHGPIPDGLCVLHKCDNKPCVNVEHLFLGTIADNNHDMIAKGRNRHPKGENHPFWGKAVTWGVNSRSAKLNPDKVKQIREMLSQGLTQRAIAKIFGVTHQAIGDIKRGVTWNEYE